MRGKRKPSDLATSYLAVILAAVAILPLGVACSRHSSDVPVDSGGSDVSTLPSSTSPTRELQYLPRIKIDTGGYQTMVGNTQWKPDATLSQIADAWRNGGSRLGELLDGQIAMKKPSGASAISALITRASLFHWEGDATKAAKTLQEARTIAESDDTLAARSLYTIIYYQGLTGLRCGENDNCVLCRGESSCILPISPAAVHTNPRGSRSAIQYFSEYLDRFPDDLEVRWLLNLAYMTLGEYPQKVDSARLIPLERYFKSEFDIGKFRDIGHLVGVNRFNQAGGAIMDDFDNDGLLDIVITSFDPTESMALFRNKGDGTFEDRTEKAGLKDQLGGLNCVQADYNNDGNLDIFIIRGAWVHQPMRPSLLRNNGDGTFTDVTKEAGLLEPVNSIAAAWADFDNDGLLDLFVCCERQPNRLYRNKGDGTFEEVAVKAGVQGNGQVCKGCAWLDYDNDGYPDLFLNNLGGTAQLFHNNRDGTFTDVTASMGIDGPKTGFSCWAWDFDNDGYLDIFATSYSVTLGDVVKGMMGQPHRCFSNKLYRNMGGKGFKDVTKEMGLDMVFATMGSNFGDFDNDGYLDMYLGTGDPQLSMLVPNRMFKNVAGKRFAEITSSSGTGHLQKGHGVACGDWDRDGNVDIFIEMGGAINGDRYHNVLFQNPGHDNSWLTVKLIGKQTNRSAIGARIKAVTSGKEPLTVHRHVSSGSSFGANPLQQTLGLGKADRVALLEIHWPTSGKTQVFRDVAVNQAIEITEFADSYRKLDWKPVPRPKETAP
jgi:hypothetical protein